MSPAASQIPRFSWLAVVTPHPNRFQGVLRMKVGDECRMIMSPDLCYGSKGFYPLIPANSALIAQVKERGKGGERAHARLARMCVQCAAGV